MNQRRNFNKKIVKYGEKWDSQYELKFFEQFILPNVRPYNSSSKLVCHVHEGFILEHKKPCRGLNVPSEKYTPDFVIYNEDMEMVHVYDVKSSINAKHPAKCATDIAKSKFRRFMTRYDIPVEVVVPRTYDFKMAMISFTKKLPITYHKNINYDIGRYVGQ